MNKIFRGTIMTLTAALAFFCVVVLSMNMLFLYRMIEGAVK